MLRTRGRAVALVVLAVAVAACVPVTVNVNFPQEKIEGAAGSIEDQVRSPENPSPPPPARQQKRGPQGQLADRLLAALTPGEAAAQSRTFDVSTDLKITPEFLKLIEPELASRRARREELIQWKAKGCVGETNQGLVELRPGEGCAGAASLVGAENADRQSIHAKFMTHYRIPASDAPRVGAAFAKNRIERARPGEWVQEADGRWVKK